MNLRYLTIAFALCSTTARASLDSNGPNGIDSIATGLTGAFVAIGEADVNRAGKPMYDTDPMNYASNTIPTGVYREGFPGMDPMDSDNFAREHATEVAGVMIAKQFPTGPISPCIECVGVAPNAELHSIGVNILDDVEIALALNRLARLPLADVKAINISFNGEVQGPVENLDGNSHFTQFIDWSARRQDILYVVAWGNDDTFLQRKPTDNYNGITVAGSQRQDGVYRKWWEFNATEGDAVGDRTSVDLMAPAEHLDILTHGDERVDLLDANGTSLAAPHVTGTVALLQEHSLQQMNLPTPNPRFGPNSQRHETMKAVLLNSADKLAGVHGSTRDVWDINNEDWTLSEAYASDSIALDDIMGAGHLNAKRAVQQLRPGEYDPGMVPSIGWDYGVVGGTQEYVFDSSIGGGYIAATLVWDRRNISTETCGSTTYCEGDQFFFQTVEDSLNNLDLYLLPASATELTPYTAASITLEDNVEHIFFNIPAGDYKLVVHNNLNGGIGDAQNYALAWWFGNAPPLFTPGDYDGNGSVGPEDYDMWRSNFGTMIAAGTGADGNGNGVIDAADYVVWRNNLSAGSGSSLAAVPEPSSGALLAVASVVGGMFARRSLRTRGRYDVRHG